MSDPVRIPLVDQIDALLPQTQCGKCGTPGCRPYAEAIAAGTPINRCVPGGADTIADLSRLLGVPALPLDPAFGVEPTTQRIAYIREPECIGCTKCIQVCPVDAIMGAAKLMHTILIDECTGCDLCVAACPVDCIEMHDYPKVTEPAARQARANQYRRRFDARTARLAAEKAVASPPVVAAVTAPVAAASAPDKSLVIAAALARTNLRKAERKLAEAMTAGGETDAIRSEVESLRAELAAIESRQAGH
ncbi:MAG TPA: RnfABCDGE type electron transport complex subunit B [Moraxellaceae bacterium]|nr:RnfABCDGE type electron transport complex subunit B [Moraxellaceae bacterium]